MTDESQYYPYASDPTKPWYLIRREDGSIEADTQDAGRAVGVPPEDVVRPEWLAADRCRRRDAHPPHTWCGEGRSPFRCKGVA